MLRPVRDNSGTMPVQVHLETERLMLRRFTADDGLFLFELDDDPNVMRYLTGGSGTPLVQIETSILPAMLAWHARSDHLGFWVVIEKSSGESVGWLHFRPDAGAPVSEPELGYRLRRSSWGRGYATEGARALIDKGFARDGVKRVTAKTYHDNLGSRRVMKKLGMRHVRSLRFTADEMRELFGVASPELFPGEDVEYAITRAEWDAARA